MYVCCRASHRQRVDEGGVGRRRGGRDNVGRVDKLVRLRRLALLCYEIDRQTDTHAGRNEREKRRTRDARGPRVRYMIVVASLVLKYSVTTEMETL